MKKIIGLFLMVLLITLISSMAAVGCDGSVSSGAQPTARVNKDADATPVYELTTEQLVARVEKFKRGDIITLSGIAERVSRNNGGPLIYMSAPEGWKVVVTGPTGINFKYTGLHDIKAGERIIIEGKFGGFLRASLTIFIDDSSLISR